MNYYTPLYADNYYHIVSRAIGSEKLFIESENYRYFLERYTKYILPIADTFAYSLLPNHFHFLTRIKSYEELLKQYSEVKKNKKIYDGWQTEFVMQQFSNLLNSYAKSFNKKYTRKGSLFMDYLRRLEIENDSQFSATTFYIHKNPVHHGYCKKITDWPWSSYKAVLSEHPTNIKRKEILDWFGNKETYVKFHTQPIQLKNAVIVE